MEFVTKEQWREAFRESNPTATEEQVDREVERLIEEMYGSEEKYEQRLAQWQEEQAEKEQHVFVSEDEFKRLEKEFAGARFEVTDPEAQAEIERRKAVLISQGVGALQAEAMAAQEISQDPGFAGKLRSDTADQQIEWLIDQGYEEAEEYRDRIRAKITGRHMNVVEAYRSCVEEEAEKRRELSQLSGRELACYEALSPDEREEVRILKHLQPEANWTYAKYWERTRPGEPVPEPEEEEPEETVPWEQYEHELKQMLKLRDDLVYAQIDWAATYGQRNPRYDAIIDELTQLLEEEGML